MRVLAEEGVLLALGTVLAVMTGIRTDAVFIAGLLLAVSVTGLVEWLHADERWPWLPCVAYLIVAAAVPAWCSFMPLVAYDMARLAAAGRPSRLVGRNGRLHGPYPERATAHVDSHPKPRGTVPRRIRATRST